MILRLFKGYDFASGCVKTIEFEFRNDRKTRIFFYFLHLVFSVILQSKLGSGAFNKICHDNEVQNAKR